MRNRSLVAIGGILLILGVVSLFVPIPTRERHGFDAGPVSFGVEVKKREKVHPAISGLLIVGGVVLIAASSRSKR